jgi:hypothetical protein
MILIATRFTLDVLVATNAKQEPVAKKWERACRALAIGTQPAAQANRQLRL